MDLLEYDTLVWRELDIRKVAKGQGLQCRDIVSTRVSSFRALKLQRFRKIELHDVEPSKILSRPLFME